MRISALAVISCVGRYIQDVEIDQMYLFAAMCVMASITGRKIMLLMVVTCTISEIRIRTVGAGYIDAVDMALEANIPSIRHGRVLIVRIFYSRVIMRRRSRPIQQVKQGGPMRAFLPQRRIGIGVAIRAIQHAGARPTGHESTSRDACIPARRYY